MKPSTSVLVERSSPSSNHSVLAAPTARARVVRRRQRQRPLLVRNGDVGADEAAQRKPQHEIRELVGRHRLDDVAAFDAERPQPVMMDQRRARMRRRPSDQACGAGFWFASGHAPSKSDKPGVRCQSLDALQSSRQTIPLSASAAAAANQIAARLIQ